MKKYDKIRIYDGHNCDMSFQLTFIGIAKGKIGKIKYSDNIVVDEYIIRNDCKTFYSQRIKNYKQMVSDFIHFQLIESVDTVFYPPIVIKHNDDYILCDVKIDDFDNYRFIKFQLKMLSNDICFYDYIGDIDNYIQNEISVNSGYSFFVNNKKQKCKNLKDMIKYYLKKIGIKEYFYSTDNIVALTNNIDKVSTKYLKRKNLGKNLFLRDLNDKKFPNLHGVFLSRYGNFLYVIRNCSNPCEEFDKILPTIENSYDILKQYIMINQYLLSEFNNYCAYNIKFKKLKRDYKIICFYDDLREGLLKKSMGSVSLVVNEFERECHNIDFSKRCKIIKKYIISEFKKRRINLNELISDTTSKTLGEIYDKTVNK